MGPCQEKLKGTLSRRTDFGTQLNSTVDNTTDQKSLLTFCKKLVLHSYTLSCYVSCDVTFEELSKWKMTSTDD